MLNYDLVTSKARYRLPRRDDLPALLRLAAQSAAEGTGEKPGAVDQILKTVQQLSKRPDRGSIFLVERKEDLVGYFVLVTGWSNRHGGEVLRVDELYLDKRYRDEGLAEDFLRLLAQVAPKDTSAILLEVPLQDRKAAAVFTSAGFTAREEKTMVRRMGKKAPADA